MSPLKIINKSTILLFALIHLAHASFSQDKRDIGIQLGGTYYYGDFNETKPLSNPSVGFGVIFRYSFNNHYSLRLSALYSSISGSYTNNRYLPATNNNSFSKSFLNGEVMGEFNFIAFNPINNKGKLTPYVNLGLGISQIGGSIVPSIPFGIGLKFASGRRHTIALEWQFHKTFTDEIDDYSAPNDGNSVIMHNNDWVSFIGFIYTYRLFNNNNTCPVYK
ncbi:MAG: DUF6089 family protein [Bacteroidales bacterium]